MRAAREIERSRTGGTPDLVKAADQPAAVLPVPVAVMVARQLRAAWQHLLAARHLAEQHGVPVASPRLGDKEPSLLAGVMTSTTKAIWDLMDWAGATAVASGAVTARPHELGDQAAKAAADQLYPDPRQWCQSPAGTLPQPGERPGEPEPSSQKRVRTLLRGKPGRSRLRAYARGRDVVPAGDVVPGTPAEPIWNAHRALSAYSAGWMDRAGDSPADLAAAVDGLVELAQTFSGVASTLCTEIRSRIDASILTGVDADRFNAAAEQLLAAVGPEHPDGGRTNQLASALSAVRDSLDDAEATVVAAPVGVRVPDRLARSLHGRSAAQIRDELGKENFVQRQHSRVDPGSNYTRADHLVRVLTWMHAANAERYDYDPDGVFGR
ncbi:hypothetical protein ACXJJ3_42010 (plasmid) [Kribbella sp. WER1]